MNFIKNFKNIFSGKEKETSVEKTTAAIVDDSSNTASTTEVENDKPFSQPEPPAMRRVIRVPAVSSDLFPPDDPDNILNA